MITSFQQCSSQATPPPIAEATSISLKTSDAVSFWEQRGSESAVETTASLMHCTKYLCNGVDSFTIRYQRRNGPALLLGRFDRFFPNLAARPSRQFFAV